MALENENKRIEVERMNPVMKTIEDCSMAKWILSFMENDNKLKS